MLRLLQPYFAVFSILALSGISSGRELTFHGPILQWHRDPTTSISFSWVEQTAPKVTAPGEWREGLSGFGYGDGDDATEIEGMRGEFERVYIAREFELGSLPAEGTLKLVIDYDDAFVAWINGIEVARSSNLKKHHHYAKVKGGHEAGEPETFILDGASAFLEKGKNLIAIEGHNVRKSSSDFTLKPMLVVGDKTLIEKDASWRYLAGSDPSTRWFIDLPSTKPVSELPKAEESNWILGIRPRGSGGGFAPLKIDEKKFGETDDPVFHAVAEKLRPNTAYEYSLRAEGRVVKTGWFRTAPAVMTKPMEFVVGGDMGTNTAIPICKLAGSLDPTFALVGGDLAYANGRDDFKWHEWIDNWTDFLVAPDGREIPIIAGIGNHEMKGLRVRKSDAPYYFSFFDLPNNNSSNWSVDFGEYMSIVLLDSNHAQKVSAQNLWLRTQLNQRKNRPHLFAIYHRPAWGVGVKRNISDIQEDWSPLFEEFGVDCVFENDHHTYKRTHKIVGGVPDEEKGILYIGDGAWGAGLREITPQMVSRVGGDVYLAKWASVHHLVKVTLNPDGTKLYEAMTSDRNVFDSFLDKSPTKPQNTSPIINLPNPLGAPGA